MTDTPLPSELVEKWLERAEIMRQCAEPVIAAAYDRCARQLQASLEAMQKGGGE